LRGNLHRHNPSEILFYKGQGEVEARGDTGGGTDRPIPYMEGVPLDLDFGKFCRQPICDCPVGGDAPSIEEPRGGK
jgi:hypothetical protein